MIPRRALRERGSSFARSNADVTVTIEADASGPIIKLIRLGKLAAATMPQARPSVGLKPLTEMTAKDVYKGEDGGLTAAARNFRSSNFQTDSLASTWYLK